MTNIIQYLDICADTLKKLADPGLTPKELVIEVDEVVLTDILLRIHGNGPYLTDKYVKEPFKAEIMNRGLIHLSRNGYLFHVLLKIHEQHETPHFFGHGRLPKMF